MSEVVSINPEGQSSTRSLQLTVLVDRSKAELNAISKKYSGFSNATFHLGGALSNLRDALEHHVQEPESCRRLIASATHSFQRASDFLLSDYSRSQRERKVLRSLRACAREVGKACSGAELGDLERLREALLKSASLAIEARAAGERR